MEHARKMILIPEESINNLHQRLSSDKVATMQTPGTPTSRLDKEMSKIINSTSIQKVSSEWCKCPRRYQ